jgi:lantibiotic modifying enzyme
MNAIVKACMETLRRVQEHLPLALKRNKNLLGYLQKFEDGLPQCQQWFNEAKQLIKGYSIQVPVKRIEEFLDLHRVSLSDNYLLHFFSFLIAVFC